jgi:acyl carrier protein
MNAKNVEDLLKDALAGVAPEGDLDRLEPDAPLREQLELDSMDFLNFVIAVHRQLGVEIPEADYHHLLTWNDALAYLRKVLAAS